MKERFSSKQIKKPLLESVPWLWLNSPKDLRTLYRKQLWSASPESGKYIFVTCWLWVSNHPSCKLLVCVVYWNKVRLKQLDPNIFLSFILCCKRKRIGYQGDSISAHSVPFPTNLFKLFEYCSNINLIIWAMYQKKRGGNSYEFANLLCILQNLTKNLHQIQWILQWINKTFYKNVTKIGKN